MDHRTPVSLGDKFQPRHDDQCPEIIKSMSKVQLNLVVIRSNNIEQAAAFYQKLGLCFIKKRHGKGLEHFAYELGGLTFEIYSCASRTVPTVATWLGFQVSSIEPI